jgi:hypothetical protein
MYEANRCSMFYVAVVRDPHPPFADVLLNQLNEKLSDTFRCDQILKDVSRRDRVGFFSTNVRIDFPTRYDEAIANGKATETTHHSKGRLCFYFSLALQLSSHQIKKKKKKKKRRTPKDRIWFK